MMNLSGLAGLQNQCHSGPLLCAHKVLVQRRNRKQRRDRHMVLVHTPVGEDQHIDTIAVCTVHLYKESVDRPLKAGILIIGNGNDLHLEALRLHILDLQQIRVGQDRIVDPEHITVLRCLLQDIALGPDIDGCRCDNLLADRVDGRVRYLRKELLEIMEERMIGLAQDRQWRIHTHSCDRLAAVLCHRENALL